MIACVFISLGPSKLRIHVESGSTLYFSETLRRYVLGLLDMVLQF